MYLPTLKNLAFSIGIKVGEFSASAIKESWALFAQGYNQIPLIAATPDVIADNVKQITMIFDAEKPTDLMTTISESELTLPRAIIIAVNKVKGSIKDRISGIE